MIKYLFEDAKKKYSVLGVHLNICGGQRRDEGIRRVRGSHEESLSVPFWLGMLFHGQINDRCTSLFLACFHKTTTCSVV